MSSTIINKLNEIKAQKDNYIRPENLKPGINVFNVVSNMPNLGDINIIPSTSAYDTGSGYVNSVHIGAIDRQAVANMEPNMTSGNIANGIVMFGVTGSFMGEGVNLETFFNYPNNEQTENTPFRMSSDLYNTLPYNISENIVSLWETYNTTDITVKMLSMDVSNVRNITHIIGGPNLQSIGGEGNFVFTNNLEFPSYNSNLGYGYTPYIIANAPKLVDITPLENWDISNVHKEMRYLIGNSRNSQLNLAPIGNWNTANITAFTHLFGNTGITSLNALNNWNTSNVTVIDYMINNSPLVNFDGLQNWDISNIRKIHNMAVWCPNLNSFNGLETWDWANINDWGKNDYLGECLFYDCNNVQDMSALANMIINEEIGNNGFINFQNIFRDMSNNTNWETYNNVTANGITNMYNAFNINNANINLGNMLKGWHLPNYHKIEQYCNNYWMYRASNQEVYYEHVFGTLKTLLNSWDVDTVSYPFAGETDNFFNNVTSMSKYSGVDFSNVDTISGVFSKTHLQNLSGFDSLNIHATNIKGLFSSMYYLNDASALSSFDTSNVKDMSYIFSQTSNNTLNLYPVHSWDTSNVENLSHAFYNINNVGFNLVAGISTWDTSNVKDMSDMFAFSRSWGGTIAIQNTLNGLGNWDTSNVETMRNLLRNQSNITLLGKLNEWDISNVKDLSYAFDYCQNLSNIKGVSTWDTSNVENLAYTFNGCNNLVSLANLSAWNTINVTNMSHLFSGHYKNFETITGIKDWDTSNVKDMSYLINWTSNTDINTISNWDISNVENMAGLFRAGKGEISVLSNWNTSKVKDMSYMFADYLRTVTNFSGLSSFNTSNVTNMTGMFNGVWGINNVDFVSNWDVSNVTNMTHMFDRMHWENFQSIEGLRNWDVSNVTNMANFLADCQNIKSIEPLSNWNVYNVLNFSNFVRECSNLQSLNGIENWQFNPNADMTGFFDSCPNLSDFSAIAGFNINCNINTTYQPYYFGSTSCNNFEFLANWRYYGNVYVYTSDNQLNSHFFNVNGQQTLSDNSLNAIVNLLQNVRCDSDGYNVGNAIWQMCDTWGSGSDFYSGYWENNSMPMTLGMANITISNNGDPDYNPSGSSSAQQIYNITLGVGLTDAQIARIQTINPEGYNNLVNNGWNMNCYNAKIYWYSYGYYY